MPFVSSSIPNLINGVSQQAPEVRLPTQAEVQENGLSSVVNGLEKRPGTEHIKKLSGVTASNVTNAFIHTIQRDDSESYSLVIGKDHLTKTISSIAYTSASTTTATITGHTFVAGQSIEISGTTNFNGTVVVSSVTDVNTVVFTQTVASNTATETSGNAVRKDSFLKVYDRNGFSYPIVDKDNTTLLNSDLTYFSSVTNPSTDITATTIADNTFLVNKKKVTAMATSASNVSGQDETGITSPTGSDELTSTYTHEALIYVKQGDYNSKYEITLKKGGNTYKVKYLTPSATPSQNQTYVGTDKIAEVLMDGQSAVEYDSTGGTGNTNGENGGTTQWGISISQATVSTDANYQANTKVGFGGELPSDATTSDASVVYKDKLTNSAITNAGFNFTRNGNVIHVRCNSAFELTSSDSHGDRDLFAWNDDVLKFTDLPPRNVPNNFILKIVGDNAKNQDDYYVKFEADTGSIGDGVWKESPGKGQSIHFDITTMPHRLVRLFDDANIDSTNNPQGITFVYEPVIRKTDNSRTVGGVSNYVYERYGWNPRRCGDSISNPTPTFLGLSIADIFFHRNRLGFLSDENVIFSEAGNYFNFFATTVLTVPDTNPIDVAVSNNQVSFLKHAVPFNESLLLFTDLQQFKLTAEQALTPTDVSIDVSTQFETNTLSKPVPAGKYVFFSFKRGEYSGVREYFVDFTNEVNDATEITSHVPQYIPGEIKKLISSSNDDMLLCLSNDTASNKNIYVYRYFWQGEEKLQSSWSTWTFDAEILDASFLGSSLYILFKRSDGIYLESINLSTDSAVEVMDDNTPVLLDRRVKIKSGTSVDTVSDIEYQGSMPSDIVFVTKDAEIIAQSLVDSTVAGGSTVYAGIPFTFKYEFSKIQFRQDNVAVTNAKLQLRNMNIIYSDSGFFKFKISHEPFTQTINNNSGGTTTITPRPSKEKIFNGYITNVSSVGKYSLLSGTFKGGIMSNTDNVKISLENDQYLPCAFQSAEWEGMLHVRSQRV
tara:strand:+ start:1153 stop:4149 length:2997 start_codon:yes stop_codon:yes gene_type:complete